MHKFQVVKGSIGRRCHWPFIIFLSTLLMTGMTVIAQQADDARAKNCRVYNSQSTDLSNEMLDIERKIKIENTTGQLRGQREALDLMEKEQKRVQANDITPEMQSDRRVVAAELGLKWDDRWNLDYAAYYVAIIAAQRKEIKTMLDRIEELKQSFNKEPAISGADLDQRHRDIIVEVKAINAKMANLKCSEVLEADRIKWNDEQKKAAKDTEKAKFLTDLKALEANVNALNLSKKQLNGLVAEAIRLSNQAKGSVALAGEIQTAFANKRNSGDSQLFANAVRNKCNLAQTSEYESQQGPVTARNKESVLLGLLKAAAAQSANCTAKEQADEILAKYKTSVNLIADIGTLAKAAIQSKVNLENAKQDVLNANPVLKAARDEVEKIYAEQNTVHGYQNSVLQQITSARTLVEDIRGRGAVINDEYLRLRQVYLTLYQQNTDDPVGRKIVDLEYVVGSALVVSVPPELQKYSEEIGRSEREIVLLEQNAEATLKRYEEVFCDISVFDNAIAKAEKAIDEIGQIVRNISDTSVEIALADISKKAENCSKGGSCAPITASIKAQLEEDNIEAAEVSIAQARTQGCPVTDLGSDLEFAHLVRRMANLLATSLETCQFDQALSLASQMSEGLRSRPLIAKAINVAERGSQAKKRIEKLRVDAANEVARTNKNASAAIFITQAEETAAGFPCLERAVGKFKDEYKVVGTPPEDPPVKKPPVRVDPPVKVDLPAAGSLPLASTWIKPNSADRRSYGSYEYIFAATKATRRDTWPPNEGGNQLFEWDFTDVPVGSLERDKEYAITVNGKFSSQLPNRDLDPPASGGVTIEGDVKIIKAQNAYITKNARQAGTYTFRVSPTAKSVTIALWADYGLSTFAIYKFGVVNK